MDEEDAALLAAVCQGSDLAFNRLIDRHQQAVRTFLRGVAAGPEDADDIAQDAFLTAWRRARSYRGGSVRSWLYSIAWRKALDARRRWSRGLRRDTAWREADLDDRPPDPQAEDLLALEQALSTLSLDQRAAVMLCVGCGLSHGEAAQALGAPLGTVKSHVLRGQARLREFFGEDP
jgi:RNA polymerase sigma-70 factor (ECF subfamily)